MRAGRTGQGRRLLVAGAPLAWLLVFFLAPFAIVLKISVSEPVTGRPPYAPAIDLAGGLQALLDALPHFDLDTYRTLTGDDLYLAALLSSLCIAAVSTLLLVLAGYPIAYAMARAPARWRPALLLAVILPFWTSFLIRIYAWVGILRPEGLLDAALQWAGLISAPLLILNTEAAIYIGAVYAYLPFMILPLYAVLVRQDSALLEAAADLGASPWAAFRSVTLPLSLPGLLAGSLLVFIPILGEFVIPDLLGGSGTLMLGRVVWNEFFSNRDWPLASAVAVVLLLLIVPPLLAAQRLRAVRGEGA